MNEETTLSQAREAIACLLPSALVEAANAYHILMNQKQTEVTKIKTHYLALKSCAAHIEQLLKISVLAEKTESKADDLPVLLKAAQAEIDSFKN